MPEDERLLAALVLVVGLFRLLRASAYHLLTPLDIGYESPNLATIQAIQAGWNVYEKTFYTSPPFGLTMYTPLYHYLVSLIPSAGDNLFLPGRLVSLLCMVAAGLLLLWTTPPNRSKVPAVIGLGVLFLMWPVTRNTALLRSDTMGLLFAAGAVTLIARRPTETRSMLAAAVLCSLAFATKQSFIAAPAALCVFLMHKSTRAAFIFTLSYVLCVAGFLIGGYFLWGSGFWFSIFSAGQHSASASEVWHRLIDLGYHKLTAVFALLSVGIAIAVLWRQEHRRSAPFPLYAAASWGVFVATAGKLGSSTNYFLEPLLASLMLVVWYVDQAYSRAGRRHSIPGVAVLLFVVVLVDHGRSTLWNYSMALQPDVYSRQLLGQAERRRILADLSERPRVLNLAHAVFTSTLPGEVSLPDVFLYALLWRNDGLDEEPLVRSIRHRHFTAIVTTDHLLTTSKEPFAGESWKRVVDAAVSYYPCRRPTSEVVLLLPPAACNVSIP